MRQITDENTIMFENCPSLLYKKRTHLCCVLTPKRAAKAKNDIEGKVKAIWEGEGIEGYRGLP